MSVQAKILSHGGFPEHWHELVNCKVNTGQTVYIAGFTIIGVPGGATFQSSTQINITLKVHETASFQFSLFKPLAFGKVEERKYMAMVSS